MNTDEYFHTVFTAKDKQIRDENDGTSFVNIALIFPTKLLLQRKKLAILYTSTPVTKQ